MIKDNLLPDMGLADPHAIVENGKVYLFCGHDESPLIEDYCRMDKWYIISSDNLIDWEIEGQIDPRDTYMTQYDRCWAGNIVKKGDLYYWYFSNKNIDTGVMVSENVTGPFKDALGHPLLAHDLVDGIHSYDPTIYCENNEYYIIFGAGNYYIAKLSEDMLSLAESPQRLILFDENGVERGNDDKSTLFKRGDQYYLCWGDAYAMSDTLKGPYTYVGQFIGGGHNDRFTFKGQDYVCSEFHDINAFYRGVSISKLDFNDDGRVVIPEDDQGIRRSYKYWEFKGFSGGWHYGEGEECPVKDEKMLVDLSLNSDVLSSKWLGVVFNDASRMTIRVHNQSACQSMIIRFQTIEIEPLFWKNESNKVERTLEVELMLKSEVEGFQDYEISLGIGEGLKPIIQRITLMPQKVGQGQLLFDSIKIV